MITVSTTPAIKAAADTRLIVWKHHWHFLQRTAPAPGTRSPCCTNTTHNLSRPATPNKHQFLEHWGPLFHMQMGVPKYPYHWSLNGAYIHQDMWWWQLLCMALWWYGLNHFNHNFCDFTCNASLNTLHTNFNHTELLTCPVPLTKDANASSLRIGQRPCSW